MTDKEFEKIRPGKTILNVKTNEGNKKMLVKFFMCNQGSNYDGYWLCCTEDLKNPYPQECREEDWDVYINNCEVISY